MKHCGANVSPPIAAWLVLLLASLCQTGLAGHCPGDVAPGDRPDGLVDSLDLNAVLALFGQSVDPRSLADTNNDGVVDSIDLNVVLQGFGQECDPPPPVVVASDFESGTMGWVVADVLPPLDGPPNVVDTFTVEHAPGQGNPGGAIRSVDPTGNEFFFSAPGEFLGDKSAFFGGTFEWDQRQNVQQPIAFEALVLTDGVAGLYYVDSGPTIRWRHYSVPLEGASFRVDSPGGAAATDAQVLEVLSNLTGVYILGDWVKVDVSWLDNVVLSPPTDR